MCPTVLRLRVVTVTGGPRSLSTQSGLSGTTRRGVAHQSVLLFCVIDYCSPIGRSLIVNHNCVTVVST